MKAIWNNKIIAESNITISVEGNQYFPADSVIREFMEPSGKHTTCPWKGEASYYDINVDGKVNEGAAWYYPQPKEAAGHIKDHIAFWKGVSIEQ